MVSKSRIDPDKNMFEGLDLASAAFRHKIDTIAAKARVLNGRYDSQGAVEVMSQAACINPNAMLPNKTYGEPLTREQVLIGPFKPCMTEIYLHI